MPPSTPALVYLHGFASGPSSYKAVEFQRRFASLGVEVLVPALDEGDFTHLTLTKQLAVVARVAAPMRPRVLVGSSMGGYLAALYASAHPVDALVLMAPAFDFARRWAERTGEEALRRWRAAGTVEVEHFAYKRTMPLALDLLDDAPNHAAFPAVAAPALVFHGRRDDTVPQEGVEQWVRRTPSARLVLFDSGHELTDVVAPMFEQTRDFLASLPAVRAAWPRLAREA